MATLLQLFKRSVIVHAFLAIEFMGSGLILNLLQLLVYCLIRPISKRLYRRINTWLIFLSWAQLVALCQWWSGSECRVWTPDEDTTKYFGTEHAMIVMNHTYEVDWLMSWVVCDMMKILSTAKSFAKKELSYVPVVGWNWAMSEHIFLERNWEKDSTSLDKRLEAVVQYDQTMLLLMFCEGTRFTKEKHEQSLAFAEQRGLPKLKYHLLPRPKGFCFCAKYLSEKSNVLRWQLRGDKYFANAVYDIEILFPRGEKPTFVDILNGIPCQADMYVRRIPFDQIPTDDNAKLTSFLYNLYKEKDELAARYWEAGNKFPEGTYHKPLKRRLMPLIVMVVWSFVFFLPIAYFAAKIILSGNLVAIGMASFFFVLVVTGLQYLVGITQASHSGSTYGSPSRTAQPSTSAAPADKKNS